MLSIRIIVVIFAVLNVVWGYNILLFFAFPGKSHTILGEGFVRPLIDAGHNITYVTPIPIKNPPSNLRQIDVSSNIGKFPMDDYLNMKKMINLEINIFDVLSIYFGQHAITEQCLKHENVQKLLLDTSEKFDVAIIEWLYSELYAGIPAIFNCPLIWSSSMEPHPMVMRLIDDIPNPAYLPDHLSPKHLPLTFIERATELWNLIYLYFIRFILSFVENNTYEEAYSQAFANRGREMPSLEEVKYNGAMMFGNSHVSSGLALRLPQNYKPIAGYHIKKEVPPLPENLQKLMDNAPDGVIYFSLGTMMKVQTMPEEMKRELLMVFSELKQVVIWKLEEQLTNLPKNVHILDWAPQPSILAHPNLVLFITHGGLLSTTETLHYGVPIIGIPLFADQFINIERAVSKGFGKYVPLGYDTPKKLKVAIEEVLSDSKYRQRVKELSLIYHDRPVSPGQEIVHWVEHVVKTKGAPHLRSISLHVPWYQKLYLDLLAIVIVTIYFTVSLVKKIVYRKKKSAKKHD